MEQTNYFERPEISNSDLKEIKKSIQHYLKYKQNPKKPTPAMEFGTAVHTYFLENDLFRKNYMVSELVDKRTKEYKNFVKENPTCIILSQEDFDKILNIESNMPNNIKELINDTNNTFEQAIIFDYNNIECRAKLDIINHEKRLIIDLKTCNSAIDIHKTIMNFEYYRQSKFYQIAMKQTTGYDYDFYFIFLETEEPFGSRLIKLDDNYLDYAKREIDELLFTYEEYLLNPSAYKYPYSNKLEIISLPYWFK